MKNKQIHVVILLSVLLAGACGPDLSSEQRRVEICDPAACDAAGPPLGAPNYTCPDGTVAGPACLREIDPAGDPGGACGWGIVDCPDDGDTPACDPDDCGPAPGAPNWTCDDGSLAGRACLTQADGSCGWSIVECPAPAPACDGPDACTGPAPGAPSYLCPDGTLAGPACQAGSDGATCGWVIVDCGDA